MTGLAVISAVIAVGSVSAVGATAQGHQ